MGVILDADGIPFLINQTYCADANPLMLTLIARSITVADAQILLRFDVMAAADRGEVT